MGETKERFTGQDKSKGINRQRVSFNYQGLNWDFIKLLGEIGAHGKEKYGSIEQYTDIRPEGDQSPINHIMEHGRQYMAREPHDWGGELKYHLAAIAYNAMMEFYYLQNGGPTVTDVLYRKTSEIPEDWPGIANEVPWAAPLTPQENQPNPSTLKQGLTKFFGGLGGGKREGSVSETGN